MGTSEQILCIGSVLWDVIGRSGSVMRVGSDVPGRITRIPGGVAFNIAMTLHRFGAHPIALSAIGRDPAGQELIAACADLGVDTSFAYRSDDLPTDVYMAIEGANGVIAAIADAHSLEAAGAKVLAPLHDGRLGSANAPFGGIIALDGNLTEYLLAEIARDPAFAAADLRVAPASPGKAERLRPILSHPGATFYVNAEEAGYLCHQSFDDAREAAIGLRKIGATRAIVTNGGKAAAIATEEGTLVATPPQVLVTRVTGAGDTFMAAHIAHEARGASPQDALNAALQAAAAYVSGDTSL